MKVEIEILVEASLSRDDVVEGITEAMDVYCDFLACRVEIVEDHKILAANSDGETIQA